MMHRRFGKFFPIVMIALLVQILAPISASWAFGVAASNPLHLAGICSDAPADSGTTDQPQTHNNCCTLCCVAQTVTPIGDAHAAFTKLERRVDVVVWFEPIPAQRPSAAGSNAQARGPPSFS